MLLYHTRSPFISVTDGSRSAGLSPTLLITYPFNFSGGVQDVLCEHLRWLSSAQNRYDLPCRTGRSSRTGG